MLGPQNYLVEKVFDKGSLAVQVITPNKQDVEYIQKIDNTFYFSGCFESILIKNGVVPGGSVGPGIVTHGFSGLEMLDPKRPYLIEGPFSDGLVSREKLNVYPMEVPEIRLIDQADKIFSNVCYQKINVRKIPPLGSREPAQIEPYEANDKRWSPETMRIHVFHSGTDSQPILRGVVNGGEVVVLGIKKAGRIYIGVPLLGVIVQQLVCPPLFGTSFYLPTRYCVPYYLETWLFEWLKELAKEMGWPYARISPWPNGQKAALTIRHDYDRPTKLSALESLLEFYRDCGVKATWFWRVGQANAEIMNMVRIYGHELALHTEREGPEAFAEELQFFADNFGLEMKGYSAHGGRGSCGHLGQRQIEWAIDAGMKYGELLVTDEGLPYPSVIVRDEVPKQTDLWVPGSHYSIDRGTKPDAYDLASAREYLDRRFERGQHVVIMNHPDIHLEELKQFLSETSREDFWMATLLETISWCRQRSALRATYVNGRDVSISVPCLDLDAEVWLEGTRGNSKPCKLGRTEGCLANGGRSIILNA
jgi:hypothetical protein